MSYINLILLAALIYISYVITNIATNNYTSQFSKENRFFKPLIILGKIAITLLSVIVITSLLHMVFDFKLDSKINILTFSAMGIIVSVLLTVTHNFYLKEEDKIKEKNNSDTEIKNLLQSLKDEINLVWTHFKDDVEKEICKEQTITHGFGVFIEITMDYFVIYNNNTDKIGKIKDKELREKIIFIEIKAKSLIDSLLFNNKVLDNIMIHQLNIPLKSRYENVLISYGTVLQDKYYELNKAIQEINSLFDTVLGD